MAIGGQGHYWFGDHVRLGLTANSNEEGDVDSNLGAADLTLRKSSDSWFKVQAGRSEGLVSSPLRSADGGFGFSGPDALSFTNAKAAAYRADLSVGLRDFFHGRDGRITRPQWQRFQPIRRFQLILQVGLAFNVSSDER